MEKGLEKKRQRVDRAQLDHDNALTAGASPELMEIHRRRVAGYADDHAGMEWEYLVGHDVEAKEMSVEIWCTDCGKLLTELDVLMDDGIVKECKISWDAIKPKQVALQIDLLERVQVLGPGRTLHLAIPKGERGRIDQKFQRSTLTKDDMRGRIQEH